MKDEEKKTNFLRAEEMFLGEDLGFNSSMLVERMFREDTQSIHFADKGS